MVSSLEAMVQIMMLLSVNFVEICNAGSFFNLTSNKCEQCPVGFYQNQTGKMQCDYCLSGMTSNRGAKSASECFGMYG